VKEKERAERSVSAFCASRAYRSRQTISKAKSSTRGPSQRPNPRQEGWWFAIEAAFDDDDTCDMPSVSRPEGKISSGCELSCSVLAPESESVDSLEHAQMSTSSFPCCAFLSVCSLGALISSTAMATYLMGLYRGPRLQGQW